MITFVTAYRDIQNGGMKMIKWEIMMKGGPVMWLIILCSVLALAISLERFWYLHRIKIGTAKLFDTIIARVKKNKVQEALRICSDRQNPMANILKAGILKYDKGRERIKEAIEDASLFEVPKLERHLTVLATVAHVAPLLGLLGTVTGMVKAFQRIELSAASFNTVNPSDLAGGIWEALLTTVAGLTVAIPTFFIYNYLVSRVNGFILDMEKASTALVDVLAE